MEKLIEELKYFMINDYKISNNLANNIINTYPKTIHYCLNNGWSPKDFAKNILTSYQFNFSDETALNIALEVTKCLNHFNK